MRRLTVFLFLLGAVIAAQAQSSSNSAGPPQSTAGQGGHAISAPDIMAAKASHKVWVNLDTGIYHKGGRWYGKTKSGRFMALDDAKKAGYKPAKRD
jgi:hypothetical protein